MTNKTRKHIWSVPLVASIAIIGVLAAFLVLANNPGVTMAQDGDPCAGLTDDQRSDFLLGGGTCGVPEPTPTSTPGGSSNDNEGSATKPSAPAMMSISRVTDRQGQARSVLPGDGKLMIDWSHPDDGGTPITGYDVRYTMTPADDDSWNNVNDLPAREASYVIMGLANGETYSVEVRAKNRLGNSPWSARKSGTPVATPSMPMQLSVADHHFPGIVVSWDAPSSGGDHPIDQYNWDVEDTASNGRSSYGTFGLRQSRMADPQVFFPERGGAITTRVAPDGQGCLEVAVSASNADDDDPNGSTRLLPGDEAMVTCADAPMLTKQVVDNVVILRWNEPKLNGGTEVTEYVIRRTGYERITDTHMTTPGPMVHGESREWRLDGSKMALWDTGLSHQTIYKYTIYAITDRYDLGYQPDRYRVSSPLTVFTSTDGGLILAPSSPPTAPRSLEAMEQCNDQITLSWMAPSNFGGGVDDNLNRHWNHGMVVVEDDATIEKYDVQYRERGRGSWMNLSATGMSAAVTSGLDYGKTYDFRVRAMNGIGLYGPWAMASKTLDEAVAPLRPTSLVVNLEEDQLAFELQWDPPSDPSGLWRTMADFNAGKEAGNYQSGNLNYVIQRQVGNGDWVTIQTQPHQYSRDGLRTVLTQEYIHAPDDLSDIRGSEVRYRVSALVNNCNSSDWNQADEVEVPAATAPEMPTGLMATAMGQNQIDLSWTAPADGGSAITGYTFEYSMDGGSTWSDPAATDSMTSHSHTGLTAGTAYTYRVTAMNGVGDSMASATTTATTAAAPALGTPSITAASNVAGSATIALAPAANATKHFVWAFRVGGTDNATDGMWSGEAAGDATSVTMTGLTSGESYWFIAIAGRGEGEQTQWSAWSDWTAPQSIQ